MEFNEFLKKADEGYNLIPIIKEIESFDREAIDIYSNHFDEKKSFFFESLEGDKNWSRYTIIGCSSGDFIEIYGNKIHKFSNFSCEEEIQHSQPIKWLEEYFNEFKGIEDYLRRVKLERMSKFPTALPGMGPEDDMFTDFDICLLYTSPSPRDRTRSRMPSSA